MNYVWDRRKSRGNLAHHGLTFEDAIGIFDGSTLEKFESTNRCRNGLEITLIYTDVSETERRIISAWRAERHERAAYWQSIG